jgi:hypothetical protein
VSYRPSISLERQDQSTRVFPPDNGDDLYLAEQFVHLATIAIFRFAMLAVMFIAQEVVPEQWIMNQAL